MTYLRFQAREVPAVVVDDDCTGNLIVSSPNPSLPVDLYNATDEFDDTGAEAFVWYQTDCTVALSTSNPPPGESSHLRVTVVSDPSFIDTAVSFGNPGSACFEFLSDVSNVPAAKVQPGDTVTIGMFAEASGGWASGDFQGAWIHCDIEMIDANEDFVEVSDGDERYFGDADGWVEIEDSMVVPAGAVYALALFSVNPIDEVADGIIDIGAFRIERTLA